MMVHVEFDVDDQLYVALQSAAEQHSMRVEDYVRCTLRNAVRFDLASDRRYSFIGIGHSGCRGLSRSVEENLRSWNALRPEGS
jgi:hypothetical protein